MLPSDGSRGSDSIVELVAGRAVVVLTILGLAEVSPTFLVALASIVFGVALLLYGAAALSQLNAALVDIRPPTTDTTGLQTMAGLAAIVLGILALSGFAPTKLVLIALLQLGCFSSLTRAVIAGTFARAFRLAPHA